MKAVSTFVAIFENTEWLLKKIKHWNGLSNGRGNFYLNPQTILGTSRAMNFGQSSSKTKRHLNRTLKLGLSRIF